MTKVYNPYLASQQLGLYQAIPFCGVFLYNKRKNTKMAILKEYIDEIKALANYQVVNYFVHLFSISIRTTNAFLMNGGEGSQTVFSTKEQRKLSTTSELY